MNNNNNEELLSVQRHKEAFIKSFADAIREAGGVPTLYLRENLTLGEMVDNLAQNGVRFCVDKKHVAKT